MNNIGPEDFRDTPEMIQRCLNCTRPDCLGLKDCAAGTHKLVLRERNDRYTKDIVRMVKAGIKRKQICDEIGLSGRQLYRYIASFVDRGLITKEQADATRNWSRGNGGGQS